jgi:hypothetical protein
LTDEAERAGRERAEYRILNEGGVWLAATRHPPRQNRVKRQSVLFADGSMPHTGSDVMALTKMAHRDNHGNR